MIQSQKAQGVAARVLPVQHGTRSVGHWLLVWRRFRRHRLAMLGLASLGILIVLSVVGPVLVPYGPLELNLLHRFQPPSPQHWFGTDELGMDTFARVMY